LREPPRGKGVGVAGSDDVVITPYRDGPLLVRGSFELRDQDGRLIDPGRDVVALCRCGKTRRPPFCDSTHKLAKFTAPGSDAAPPAS
jgi:CDGSH-type Zn-finger protein